MPKIEEDYGPLKESVLVLYEKKWGYKLPEPYRDFLLSHNGGYPEPDAFNFKNKDTGSSVDRFLGIDIGEYDNLIEYLENYKNRIPNDLFPIAHDPGGNLICICISGDNYGKIFFWDHDIEADEGELPDYSNITLISDSFEEFMNNLYELK
jgi:hypothetical protein